ncbi:hypothetical protein [Streptomyces sp. NPDC000878]
MTTRPTGQIDTCGTVRASLFYRAPILSETGACVFRSQGYTFLLQADPSTGQTMRPPGMRTILVPPSNMAGVVSAGPVTAGIERKVSKYRALAQEAGLPLIVAVGADKFTGLQVQHLDDLLEGVFRLSVQFNFGDSFIHHPVEVDPFNPPRWTMPPELAGVLWVNNDFPFTTAWRPNPAPVTPAPPALTAKEGGLSGENP